MRTSVPLFISKVRMEADGIETLITNVIVCLPLLKMRERKSGRVLVTVYSFTPCPLTLSQTKGALSLKFEQIVEKCSFSGQFITPPTPLQTLSLTLLYNCYFD